MTGFSASLTSCVSTNSKMLSLTASITAMLSLSEKCYVAFQVQNYFTDKVMRHTLKKRVG